MDVELLYNSVKTEVRQLQLEIGRSYRRDVVGKATPGRRGSGPLIEWASGPPVEHQENKKDTTLTSHKSGGQNISVLFVLQLPLTVEPLTTLSNLANKLRGKYFL